MSWISARGHSSLIQRPTIIGNDPTECVPKQNAVPGIWLLTNMVCLLLPTQRRSTAFHGRPSAPPPPPARLTTTTCGLTAKQRDLRHGSEHTDTAVVLQGPMAALT
ncbi:hypothetical protein J1614_005240 [Plenodomus biglobosus]|nr:hypothetical protein J1614_005240 [Plenodomus biglobosus]